MQDLIGVRMQSMPKPYQVLILALALLINPLNSRAQNTTEAVLSTPDASMFPIIRANLRVIDAERNFVSGLTPADVNILENNVEIPASSIEVFSPGVQIVVAINPSPAFAVRDSTGATRYDYVRAALTGWAESNINSENDQLSLIMTNGPNDINLTQYSLLQAALSAAPEDHRNADSNLQTLATAIDIAGDPTPRPGMGKAVLFITQQAENDMIPALDDMISRAQQTNVRIFVWMVTSEAYFETSGATALQGMAEATGGGMFAYSGSETFPNPDSYFEALRKIYSLTYESANTTSGNVEIAAKINASGYEALSAPSILNITVLPPNPIFVSPPDGIYRSLVPNKEGELSEENRTPSEQEFEILIEFPDGHPRDLARTTLYVNGQIADENTAPPFDKFTWDLSNIVQSDRYSLQVEALDQIGLSSISLETPINITVQRIPDGFVPAISRNSSVVVTVVVVLVGILLISVLLRIRKLRPSPVSSNGGNTKKKSSSRPDPVFQVAEESQPAPTARITRWANRLHWPQRAAPRSEPIAFLERIFEPDTLEAMTPIPPFPIHTTEITIGTDPSQATFVLEDPSVADLHARLHRNENREFFISDFGTISGTYINYLPTNGDSKKIEHGDLLHLGKACFRLQLNPAPQTTEPSVEPEEKSFDTF